MHAGWRGLAAGVLDAGVAAFSASGIAAGELLAHVRQAGIASPEIEALAGKILQAEEEQP